MHGILGMDNGAPASGVPLFNVQGGLNQLYTGTGATETTPGTTYTSQTVITNGDNHQAALGKLDAKFHHTTGHTHDGTAGNGGPIAPGSIGSIPLFGTYVQGANLLGITGTSTNVTANLSGETPSTLSTVEGVPVNVGPNRVLLLSALAASYEERLRDVSGNPVYGRLTEAAGVWTLSFFKYVLGVETAHNFTGAVDLIWFYQKLFKRIVNAPVYSDQLAQEWPRFVGTSVVSDEVITPVNFASSPYTVLTADRVLIVDATGGNVVINLYAIGGLQQRLRIKKIDASANTVTINPFAGDAIDNLAGAQVLNFQNEGVTYVTSTLRWNIFA
jgi:hypothetical protein